MSARKCSYPFLGMLIFLDFPLVNSMISLFSEILPTMPVLMLRLSGGWPLVGSRKVKVGLAEVSQGSADTPDGLAETPPGRITSPDSA